MPAPATFLRRYAAYSADLAIVAVIAVPLLAWQLQALPAALDAAIATLQARVDLLVAGLFEASLHGTPGLPELARTVGDDPALRAGVVALLDVVLDAIAVAALTIVLVAAVWFVGFESSPRHATPGKAALGLRVAAADGGPPSFGQALGRFVAGAPSWAVLHLGHAMAAWTKERRALHDLLAGTRVEQRDPPDAPLPAWAKAWLAAQLAGFFGLVGVVLLRYAQLFAGAFAL